MFYALFTNAQPVNTSLGNTLVTLVAFVFLVYFIKKFTWGPLMAMLTSRQEKITNDLQAAQDNRSQANEERSQAQRKLQDARIQANQMILDAKKQSLQIQDNMIKDAKEEAEKIRSQAREEMAQERIKLFNEVKHELTEISIEIAEKILHREITDNDHRKLIDDFIHGMDE